MSCQLYFCHLFLLASLLKGQHGVLSHICVLSSPSPMASFLHTLPAGVTKIYLRHIFIFYVPLS